jgi:hypothetical protein
LCIDSWEKVLPGYDFILWDKNRFDIESVSFVSEAVRAKKWAFASDYIRMFALFSEGGIYLDSDVLVKKSFDQFLCHDFFSSVLYHTKYVKNENTLSLLFEDGRSRIPFTPKPGIGIQAAVLGSVKGHAFLADCMEFYSKKHFIKDDGTLYNSVIAPDIYAMIAEKYGFRYVNEYQCLKNNMVVFPSDVFAGNLEEATENSYSIHLCEGSWYENDSEFRKTLKNISQSLGVYDAIIKFYRKPIQKLTSFRKNRKIRKIVMKQNGSK